MITMAAAMLIVPAMDAIAKFLARDMPPIEIAFLRFVLQTAVLLPLSLVVGGRLRTSQWRLHAARGILMGGAMIFFFSALKYLPLANAIAIFFVEPLILTLLSFVALGERFGPRRLVAVLVGLLGAMVVIRPNWAEFGPASLLPLGAATLFAAYLALTRRSGANEDAIALQLWAGLFGAIFLGLLLAGGSLAGVEPLTLEWPAPHEWAWLVALGAISALGHVMIAFAFTQAPASQLAPFQYLEIISATLLGYVVFQDFPDALSWLGTAIIVCAGLYVFVRERKAAAA